MSGDLWHRKHFSNALLEAFEEDGQESGSNERIYAII
jgi:hypothetical protein